VPLEVPLEVAVRADDVAPVGAAIRLAVDPAAVVHFPPTAPAAAPLPGRPEPDQTL